MSRDGKGFLVVYAESRDSANERNKKRPQYIF